MGWKSERIVKTGNIRSNCLKKLSEVIADKDGVINAGRLSGITPRAVAIANSRNANKYNAL